MLTCLISTPLLDKRWVSSGAIDGVLAELAVLSPGMQLMSSENAFIHLCKLKQNGLVRRVDVIDIQPGTHTLGFPFNLLSNHWCVAKATCHKKKRLLTVYNSLTGLDDSLDELDPSGMDAELIET